MKRGAISTEVWESILQDVRPALLELRQTDRPILWFDLSQHPDFAKFFRPMAWESIFSGVKALRAASGLHDAELAVFEPPHQTVGELKYARVGAWVALEGQITRIEEQPDVLWRPVYDCFCGGDRAPEGARWAPLGELADGGGYTPSEWHGEYPRVLDACPNCKKPNVFLNGDASTWVPSVIFEASGLPDEANANGELPRVRVRADGYMTDHVLTGQEVKICGVMRAPESKRGSRYIHASSVRLIGDEDFERSITEQDRERIRSFIDRHRGTLIADVVRSCYGDWVGWEPHKAALVLQLVGGTPGDIGTETLTGCIHVALVGDPSTAKTALMRRSVQLRGGRFTLGPGSSGVGLTAYATDPDKRTGHRRLEPGAMVLADRKILAIDEAARIRKEDLDKLYDALQSGQVTIHKAAWGTMNARASVIFALNPKKGRWDKDDTNIVGQTGFDEALLSRCHYLALMLDKPNAARDAEIADKILAKHEGEAEATEINEGLLRKYLFLAHRTEARLAPEARVKLRDYYVSIRQEFKDAPDGSIPITARQLAGLYYMTTAFAKLRLDTVASPEDAAAAIELTRRMLSAFDPNRLDATIMDGRGGGSDRSLYAEVERLMLGQNEPLSAVEIAEKIGAPDVRRVVRACDYLCERGRLIDPRRDGRFRQA